MRQRRCGYNRQRSRRTVQSDVIGTIGAIVKKMSSSASGRAESWPRRKPKHGADFDRAGGDAECGCESRSAGASDGAGDKYPARPTGWYRLTIDIDGDMARRCAGIYQESVAANTAPEPGFGTDGC